MKTRIRALVLAMCLCLLCGAALADNSLAFEPYAETVTIARAQKTTGISLWENGDTATNNPWTRLAKDKLNINLVDEWNADGTQYESKINIAIGSDTLPDVFLASSAQLAQIVEAGMAYDLTEAYNAYASDDVRMLEDADPIGFQSGVFDGQLLGLSCQHFGLIASVKYMWIRQDWLDKLNMTAPTTYAELEALCEAFVTMDPDGNNVDDTYAIGMNKSLSNFLSFATMFHALPNIWYEGADGKLVYGNVQPEMKTALAAAQDMFKKGYFSPEFSVMDKTSMRADGISGKSGIMFESSSLEYSIGADLVNTSGADAYFKAYPIPTADGEPVMHPIVFPVSDYVVVSSQCKNPEAVIKLLNAFIDIQLNADEETYAAYFNSERSWGMLPMQIHNALDDYNQGKYIPIAVETGDTSMLNLAAKSKYNLVLDWIEDKTPTSVGTYFQVSGEGSYRVGVQVIDEKQYVYDAFRGVATPTMATRKSTLDAMLTENFTKIIMGEDLSAFDKLVEQWHINGGTDMTNEMNAGK